MVTVTAICLYQSNRNRICSINQRYNATSCFYSEQAVNICWLEFLHFSPLHIRNTLLRNTTACLTALTLQVLPPKDIYEISCIKWYLIMRDKLNEYYVFSMELTMELRSVSLS
uniref:Uncharacterized protein n=1 Tax=Rhizophagus irregularis (strain DAOM 181602 / DAOM 197198 / MUCL 43194) TaxID=747089 RepID=U9SWW8_RHIID